MPQRKRQSGQKFKDKPRQIKDNGVRVDLGGVDEFTWHCRWQFHRLLEQLINDPYAPNRQTISIASLMVSQSFAMLSANVN